MTQSSQKGRNKGIRVFCVILLMLLICVGTTACTGYFLIDEPAVQVGRE